MSTALGQAPLEPAEYIRGFLRRKWLFLLVLVSIPAAVLAYSLLLEKRYESTATIRVQRPAADLTALIVRDQNVQPDFDQPRAVRLAARTVKTPEVAALAVRGRAESPGGLLDRISAGTKEQLGLVTITASASSAGGAAALANDFASALAARRVREARSVIDAAIASVRSSGEAASVRRTQLARLRALRAAQTGDLQILVRAVPSAAAASPRPARNAAAALILALLLASAAVLVVEWLDRRIHRMSEVERLTGLPLLATIPSDGPEVAFEVLRDTLIHFNAGRELRS